MKKAIILLILILAAIAIPGAAHAQQVIKIAPSGLPVDPNIEQAVYNALSIDYRYLPSLDYWYAISNVSDKGGGVYLATVLGLDNIGPEGWNLMENGKWYGIVRVEHSEFGWVGVLESKDLPATYQPIDPLSARGFEQPAAPSAPLSADAVDEVYIFPWQPGMAMQLWQGTHTESNWAAIDIGSDGDTGSGHAPNLVYAAGSGDVTVLCRNGDPINDIILEVGNLLYIHLLDTGQETGDYYVQGQQIGTLVTGSYPQSSGPCDTWADQLPGHFHIHLGFPANVGYVRFEKWTYDKGASQFIADGETKSVNDWLLAEWSTDGGGDVIPPPGAPPPVKTNFWSLLLSGVTGILSWLVYGRFPSHTQIGLAQMVVDYTTTSLSVLFIIIFSQINPTLPLISFTVLVVSEGTRGVYALWRLILKLIPMAG